MSEHVVVLGGRTFLTVAGLAAYYPKHPLLDRVVKHYEEGREIVRRPAREDPELLVAELSR